MHRFLVVYSDDASYSQRISQIVSILETIKERWAIEYRLENVKDISEVEMNALTSQIRAITPQKRGKIVSVRGNILPLSHSKKLNVENTIILILYKDDIPLQVFPHMLGEAYITVEEGMNRILKEGPEEKAEGEGLLEGPLQKLLASTPEMLEDGASCLGLEIDVEFGVADLIFRGGDERPVVLEIKIHADDSAVGQVSRIAKGYADKEAVDPQSVRKAIVCLSYVSTLVEACKGANIELYKVSLNRV